MTIHSDFITGVADVMDGYPKPDTSFFSRKFGSGQKLEDAWGTLLQALRAAQQDGRKASFLREAVIGFLRALELLKVNDYQGLMRLLRGELEQYNQSLALVEGELRAGIKTEQVRVTDKDQLIAEKDAEIQRLHMVIANQSEAIGQDTGRIEALTQRVQMLLLMLSDLVQSASSIEQGDVAALSTTKAKASTYQTLTRNTIFSLPAPPAAGSASGSASGSAQAASAPAASSTASSSRP